MSLKIELFLLVLKEQLEGIRPVDVELCIVLAILFTAVYYFATKKNESKNKTEYLLLVFFSVLWFLITLFITLIRRQPESLYHKGDIIPYFELGALDNKYSQKQIIYNIFNILLFVPVGFFIRAFGKKVFSFKENIISILAGFLFSFSIEFIQLLTKRGTFEVSDIVTNCIGACFGVFIFELFMRIYKNGRIK